MAWFRRRKTTEAPAPRPEKLNTQEWAYAHDAHKFQEAIGTSARDVVVSVRLKKGKTPEIGVYLEGRKVGSLNHRAVARIAPVIAECAPGTLSLELPGLVISTHEGRMFGVQVRYPE